MVWIYVCYWLLFAWCVICRVFIICDMHQCRYYMDTDIFVPLSVYCYITTSSFYYVQRCGSFLTVLCYVMVLCGWLFILVTNLSFGLKLFVYFNYCTTLSEVLIGCRMCWFKHVHLTNVNVLIITKVSLVSYLSALMSSRWEFLDYEFWFCFLACFVSRFPLV